MIRAEEVHNSLLFAAILAISGLAMLTVAATHSILGIRILLGISGVIVLGAAAMALGGFHYLFSSAGVEIRTLGFRVRTISREEIRDYRPDRWNVAGGYGIRGLGASKAYVWGNRGVRIKTANGQVFLGCDDPQKLVRELDLVTGG
jgi:hypothetical protein